MRSRPRAAARRRSDRAQPAGVAVGATIGGGAVAVPYVSPRRGGARRSPPAGRAAADRPGRARLDLPGDRRGRGHGPDQDDEPSVPDEARARIVADATADAPTDAGPETILHVRFAGSAPPDRVVGAMEAFKAVLRDRPGATRVVIHVPAPGGGAA